jgi:hypothetical protein
VGESKETSRFQAFLRDSGQKSLIEGAGQIMFQDIELHRLTARAHHRVWALL